MTDSSEQERLRRQIEQADRLACSITDQTTVERFRAFAGDLRQRLRRFLRRDKYHEAIRARAYELWERAGWPSGRDLEFWLQAERELKDQAEQIESKHD